MTVFEFLLIAVLCATFDAATTLSQEQKPNIVIMLVDDMGINDVSFHGSNQILTPNIDALAYSGVILNQLYVPNLCTPSRASLMTGKYPIHTGTQHLVILNDEPWGLPLSERILPEIFHDAGYSTNLIGKWHLGFSEKSFTPTLRGFDHFVGYYSGYISYFDHDIYMSEKNYSRGYDFRKDLEVNYDGLGTYATDYFTDEAIRVVQTHNKERPLFLLMSHLAVHSGNVDIPLEAPPEEIAKFSYIKDPNRRIYAAMMSKLDESVGRLMRALSEKKMLENTIVLFYSDNGAPTLGGLANSGSNYPFKGQKRSPWEGGIRSAGAIWSPLIKSPHTVSQQKIHPIDWLPTLASAVGIQLPPDVHVDGIDLWNTLRNNGPLQSRNFVHVLDDVDGYSSYMRNNLKYINGTEPHPEYATWLGDLGNSTDPRAYEYAKWILNSEVSQAIELYKLTAVEIEFLRNEATIQCTILPNVVPNEGVYKCEPPIAPCLFAIEEDPCEMYNLAKIYPDIVKQLAADIERFRNVATEPANNVGDPYSNPAFHNYTWTWWRESNASPRLSSPNGFSSCVLILLSMSYEMLLS